MSLTGAWMGSPPEVHSALLAAGPGAGSLLAAAAAWSNLAAEYAAVAEELTALVGDVRGGAWQGVASESYGVAHVPYLGWLARAAADSAAAAARCDTAAGAYVSALAAMPTMPELAANHAVHGVLVATNFFGINTVPIAVNEADYARMWVQAATTMSTYEAVAGSAVASVPHTGAAPQIVEASGGDHDHEHGGEASEWDQMVAQWLRSLTGGRVDWDPSAGTVNGIGYDSYTNPGDLMYWVVRALEFSQDFQHFGNQLLTNPGAAFQYLFQLAVFDWPTHIAQIATWLGQSPQLVALALGAALTPVGSAAGLAGLAGLAAPQPAAPILPVDPGPHALPALGTAPPAPAVSGSVSASAPAPPAPASAAAGPAPAPAAPPAAAGATFIPPYLIGGPGIGTGSGMAASARAARKASEPDSAAAAAAAREVAREQKRAQRRRRAAKHEHADEFMKMGVGVDPDWQVPDDATMATERGAGSLGFSGNAPKAHVAAGGMARLSGSAFGGGPKAPMVPGSWGAEETGSG